MQVSVIVPVYNVEPFLVECIESILVQEFQSFELLLVNDGSTDRSGDICDEYALKVKNVRVIHQENQGVSQARAAGVNMASGEWVMFVDGDDTLRPDALHSLSQYIESECDIIEGIFDSYKGNRVKDAILPNEYREKLLHTNGVINSLWGKLYRRTLFSSFIFDIPRMVTLGEDFIANLRLSYRVQGKILLVDDVVYNYRVHAGSASHSLNKTVSMQRIIFHELMKSIPENDWQSREYIYRDAIFHFCESICHKVRLSEEELAFRKDLLLAPRSVFRGMLKGHLLTLMITNPLIRFAIRLGAIKR